MMILHHGDGRKQDVPKNVSQAFAALARGDASGGQQRLCMTWIFMLTNPMGFTDNKATERSAGMAEGARIVGLQIAQLVGGETPWTLKHLGEVNDDGND